MHFYKFGGMIPKQSRKSLSDDAATFARNMDVYGNRLTPLYYPKKRGELLDVNGNRFTGVAATIEKVGDIYVAWDKIIHTAPDYSHRLGYNSFLFVDDGQLWRQSAERILTGKPPVKVGIEPPSSDDTQRPTAEVISDAGCERVTVDQVCMPEPSHNCEDRQYPPEATAYLFTYVTACQEESAPSRPTEIVDTKDGDAVKITFHDTPPENAVARRVYRSVSTTDGTGVFLFVGESQIGDTEFYDMACDDNLGEALQTEDHFPPPDCLEGVTAIGDNVTVLWSNRHIYFSQHRLPHAYGLNQELRLRFPIYGAYEITDVLEGEDHYYLLVVCDGLNYIIHGSGGEEVSVSEVQTRHYAFGPHSVCNTEAGLLFACRQGICSFTTQGIELITGEFLTEKEWVRYSPEKKRICYDDDRIIGFGEGRNFIITLGTDKRRPMSFVEYDNPYEIGYAMVDKPMIFARSGWYYWIDQSCRPMTYEWRSIPIVMAGEWRPTFLKVVSYDFARFAPDLEYARLKFKEFQHRYPHLGAVDFIESNPKFAKHYNRLTEAKPSVTIILFADGVEYYRRQVSSSKPFQIPRRHKALDWEVVVIGSLEIEEIHIQSSRESLVRNE